MNKCVLSLSFLIFALGAIAQENSMTPPPSTKIPTTTDDQNITTTTTSQPTTTVSTTTSTTVTTTVHTNTTTAAPKPTLEPPSSSDEEPPTGTWNVSDAQKKGFCIIDSMGLKMAFTYQDTTKQNKTIYFDLPVEVNKTTVTGTCGRTSSSIIISFFEDWAIEMDLEMKSDNKTFIINAIKVTFVPSEDYFQDIAESSTKTVMSHAENLTFPDMDHTRIYRCKSKETVKNFRPDAKVNSAALQEVRVYDITLSAYTLRNSTTNQNEWTYCEADTKINNIVPIVVGAALAGLVAIVLIAYLIGRKRRMSGYESV